MLQAAFAPLRFMILDDEIIVALDLEHMLTDLGHFVVGTANRMEHGMKIAQEGGLDMAILDINVRGVLSFPIAEVLRSRDVPFIFASGYGQRGLIDAFRDAHVLTKPFDIDGLARMVAQACGSPNRQGPDIHNSLTAPPIVVRNSDRPGTT
jgi:DNA-binding NtrC family response regulator